MFAVPLYRYINPRVVLASLCALTAVALLIISNAGIWWLLIPGVLAICCGQAFSYTFNSALCLSLVDDRDAAQNALAKMRSFGPLAALCATASILLFEQSLGYKAIVGVVAVVVLIFSLYLFFARIDFPLNREKVRLKIKNSLWPYYALNALSGARSALFKTFVITLLIREHDFDMARTSGLILASTIAGFIGYRALAWLSDRVDPKYILGFVHTTVGFLFIGFATVPSSEVLVVLFLFDSMIFGVAAVTDSTLRRFVAKDKIVGQLSTGMSLFYVMGIVAPIVGGAIASFYSLDVVFLFAAAVAWTAAVVSQIYCARASRYREQGLLVD